MGGACSSSASSSSCLMPAAMGSGLVRCPIGEMWRGSGEGEGEAPASYSVGRQERMQAWGNGGRNGRGQPLMGSWADGGQPLRGRETRLRHWYWCRREGKRDEGKYGVSSKNLSIEGCMANLLDWYFSSYLPIRLYWRLC